VLLALAGLKGGIGKTTTAVQVAVECVARGYRVLLVDLDPVGNLKDWADQAAESTQVVPPTLALGRHVPGPEGLRALAHGYDLVVLDCPPADAEVLLVALMAADMALLPCSPSPLDVWALGPTLQVVDAVRKQRPQLVTHVLITQQDDRTHAAARARSALTRYGLSLFETMLGARVAYAESLATGQGVTRYDPQGLAATEVHALVDELSRCALLPTLSASTVH
jgi:chromosome partitioning protein